jgi:hypothetical protein
MRQSRKMTDNFHPLNSGSSKFFLAQEFCGMVEDISAFEKSAEAERRNYCRERFFRKEVYSFSYPPIMRPACQFPPAAFLGESQQSASSSS